uniref:Small ribosomal subunit protein uS3m n=1 Tax=Roya obtusa TaxID=104537 RepID=U5YEG6_9VIRI|nr:ribosomal protein S3 [Roya obtusa]AGZ90393.1 ribosomal protein S3 [Roya obtusa]
MSQKINPIAVRLKFNRTSDSSWFSDYYYSSLLFLDFNFQNYLKSITDKVGSKNGFQMQKCIIYHLPKKSTAHLFCLKDFKLKKTLKKKNELSAEKKIQNNFNINQTLTNISKNLKKNTLNKKPEFMFQTDIISLNKNIPGKTIDLNMNCLNLSSNLDALNKSSFSTVLNNTLDKTYYYGLFYPIFILLKTYGFTPKSFTFFKDVFIQKSAEKKYILQNSKGANKISEWNYLDSLDKIQINNSSIIKLMDKPAKAENSIYLKFANKLKLFENLLKSDWFLIIVKNNKLGQIFNTFSEKKILKKFFFNYYCMHYFFMLKTNTLDIKLFNDKKKSCFPLFTTNNLTSSKKFENLINKKKTNFFFKDNNQILKKSRHYFFSNIKNTLSFQTNNLVKINPINISNLFQSASLVAQEIAWKLEQKKSFRTICRTLFLNLRPLLADGPVMDIKKIYKKNRYIKGIRISCSGRLNGAEIAKTECKKYSETSLHVFSDKIDYAFVKALTPYGILGIKVWISYVK